MDGRQVNHAHIKQRYKVLSEASLARASEQPRYQDAGMTAGTIFRPGECIDVESTQTLITMRLRRADGESFIAPLDQSQIGSDNRSASNSRERSLCSEPKDALDEAYVFLCQPTHLSLADHVHRLVALDRS